MMIFLSKRMEIAPNKGCIVFGKVVLYPKRQSFICCLPFEPTYQCNHWMPVACCASTTTASEDSMKTLKIFMSRIIRPRATLFDMYLVNLYQVS